MIDTIENVRVDNRIELFKNTNHHREGGQNLIMALIVEKCRFCNDGSYKRCYNNQNEEVRK